MFKASHFMHLAATGVPKTGSCKARKGDNLVGTISRLDLRAELLHDLDSSEY